MISRVGVEPNFEPLSCACRASCGFSECNCAMAIDAFTHIFLLMMIVAYLGSAAEELAIRRFKRAA